MPAAFVFGALAALAGCGPDPGPEPAPPPADRRDPVTRCEPYRDVPNAWGYCLFSEVRTLVDPAAVGPLCAQAGSWRAECVRTWVTARLEPRSGFSTEALLQVCGDESDCALEVLDARASGDVADQIARCAAFAGTLGSDCAGHAMERWWLPGPSDAEIRRVAGLSTAFPDRVAFFIAASVVCEGKGTCDGEPALEAACEKAAGTFRADRMKCPGRRRPVPAGGAPPRTPGSPDP